MTCMSKIDSQVRCFIVSSIISDCSLHNDSSVWGSIDLYWGASLYLVEMIDRLPTLRKLTISGFEIRSILRSIFISCWNYRAITYFEKPDNFQCLRFDRSVLRSIFMSCWNDRSIFGAMVLGSINFDDYRSNLKIELVTDSLAKSLILRIAVVEVVRWRSLPIWKS